MNPKATPLHEELNRRQIQPEFLAPLPQPTAPVAKGKGKSTLETKSKSVASNSKAATTTKSGKRFGQPNARQSSKRKKTADDESDPVAPPADQVAKSDAKSFKPHGQIPKGFTTGHTTAQRLQLIHRGFTNSSDVIFLNRSISEILVGSDKNVFHAVMNQVRKFVQIIHFRPMSITGAGFSKSSIPLCIREIGIWVLGI